MSGLEFDCQDCGIHVFAYGLKTPPDPPRCATCLDIRTAPMSSRPELRQRLLDSESLEYWAMIGCWRDEDFPARACDKCGQSYQGPSVFCCFECAQAAA